MGIYYARTPTGGTKAYKIAGDTPDEAEARRIGYDLSKIAPAPVGPAAEEGAPGVVEAGFQGGLAALDTGIAGAMYGLGWDDTAGRYEQSAADRAKYVARRTPVGPQSLEDIGGVGDAIGYAYEMVGSGLGSTVPAILGAGAGAVGGALTAGPFGVVPGSLVGAGSVAFGQQTGEMLQAQQAVDGRSLKDADLGRAALFAAPAAALDTLSTYLTFGLSKALGVKPGNFVRALVGASPKKAAAAIVGEEAAKSIPLRVLAGAGKGFATEGLTEGTQQALQEMQADPDRFWEFGPEIRSRLLNSLVGGGLAGGVIGGAVDVFPDRADAGERRIPNAKAREQLAADLAAQSLSDAEVANRYAQETAPRPAPPLLALPSPASAPPARLRDYSGRDRPEEDPVVLAQREASVAGADLLGPHRPVAVVRGGRVEGFEVDGPLGDGTVFPTSKEAAVYAYEANKREERDQLRRVWENKTIPKESIPPSLWGMKPVPKQGKRAPVSGGAPRDMTLREIRETYGLAASEGALDQLATEWSGVAPELPKQKVAPTPPAKIEYVAVKKPVATKPFSEGKLPGTNRADEALDKGAPQPKRGELFPDPESTAGRWAVMERKLDEDGALIEERPVSLHDDAKSADAAAAVASGRASEFRPAAPDTNAQSRVGEPIPGTAPDATATTDRWQPQREPAPTGIPVRNTGVGVRPAPAPVTEAAAEEEASPAVKRDAKAIRDALKKRLDQVNLGGVRLDIFRWIKGQSANNVIEGSSDSNLTGRQEDEVIKLATGVWEPGISDTELAKRLVGVLNHEIIHTLRNLGVFTDTQWAALKKYASTVKVPGKLYTFLDLAVANYPDIDIESQTEEAIAEAFRSWVDVRKSPLHVSSLFRRIINFFRALGESFASREGKALFEKIDQGKLNMRTGNMRPADAESLRYSKRAAEPKKFSSMDALGFRSPTADLLLNIRMDKASAAQWKKTILNSPGVKMEELAVTGLPIWLDAQGDSVVSKEALLSFIKANNAPLVEVVLGRELVDYEGSETPIDFRDARDMAENAVGGFDEWYESKGYDNKVKWAEIDVEGSGPALKTKEEFDDLLKELDESAINNLKKVGIIGPDGFQFPWEGRFYKVGEIVPRVVKNYDGREHDTYYWIRPKLYTEDPDQPMLFNKYEIPQTILPDGYLFSDGGTIIDTHDLATWRIEDYRPGDELPSVSSIEDVDNAIEEILHESPDIYSNEDELFNEAERSYQDTLDDVVESLRTGNPITVLSPDYIKYTTDGGEKYREVLIKKPNSGYRAPHFNGMSHDIVAHMRLKDRFVEGRRRVLFAEELQSDLHQKGRKDGYIPLPKKTELGNNLPVMSSDYVSPRVNHIRKIQDRLRDLLNTEASRYWRDEILDRIDALDDDAHLAQLDAANRAVPSVIWSQTWHEQLIKRLIGIAVNSENSDTYDYIGWTTGDLQKKLYKTIVKEAKEITYDLTSGNLRILDENQHALFYGPNARSYRAVRVSRDMLHDILGAELADRLLKPEAFDPDTGTYNIKSEPDKPFKYGGLGHHKFYDQIIPKFVEKYVKKWGSSVEKIDYEDGFTAWAAKITPEMRADVNAFGQTAFSQRVVRGGAKPEGKSASPLILPSKNKQSGKPSEQALGKLLDTPFGEYIERIWSKGLLKIVDTPDMFDDVKAVPGLLTTYGYVRHDPNAPNKYVINMSAYNIKTKRPFTQTELFSSFMHEVFHAGPRAIAGRKKFDELIKNVDENIQWAIGVFNATDGKAKSAADLEEYGLTPDEVTEYAKHITMFKKVVSAYENKNDWPEETAAFLVGLSNDSPQKIKKSLNLLKSGVSDWVNELYDNNFDNLKGVASKGAVSSEALNLIAIQALKIGWDPVPRFSARTINGSKISYTPDTATSADRVARLASAFSGSKIVNSDGTPIRLYHGTSSDSDFNSFKNKDRGTYLTADTATASMYAKDNDSRGLRLDGGKVVEKNTASRVMPVYVMLKNPKVLTGDELAAYSARVNGVGGANGYMRGQAAEARTYKNAGYDGLVLGEIGALNTTYIAFNPASVKSAIANNGNYDFKDKNIKNVLRPIKKYSASTMGIAVNPTSPKKIAARQTNIIYGQVADMFGKVFGKVGIGQDTVDTAFIKLQDKALPLGRMVDAVRAMGGNVEDSIDPKLAEELYAGRAGDRVRKNEMNLYQPLMNRIKALGFTTAQGDSLARIAPELGKVIKDERSVNKGMINAFLYARHAGERNAVVRARNPDIDEQIMEALAKGDKKSADKLTKIKNSGSGISDAEARAALMWFSQQPNYDRMLGAERDMRAIIDNTNKTYIEYGLVPPDIADVSNDPSFAAAGLPNGFKYYVPLRSFREEDIENDAEMEDRFGSGMGFKIRGSENRTFTGRSRIAGSILINAIMQNEIAIIRGEKNVVGNSMLGLLQANTAALSDMARLLPRAPMVKTVNSAGVVQYVPEFNYKNRDDVFVTKVNGKEVAIEFADKRIAQALNGGTGLADKSASAVVRAIGTVTRIMASLNTAWNPEFTIPNLLRDIQTAGINITQYGDGFAKDIIKNIPAAMRAIHSMTPETIGTKKTAAQAGEFGIAYERMSALGGKTDFWGIKGLRERVVEANRELTLDEELTYVEKGARKFGKVLNFIEAYNETVETATRLSVFKALTDKGFSEERAAQAAKNVVTNFNKGGEWKGNMNAFYMFFNAAIQGTYSIAAAAATSPKVRKIIGGIVVAGFAQDMLMSMLGGEDDDGENIYDKIPEYLLETRMVFLDPFGITDRGYFAIPMPYGYNAFHNMGRSISRTIRGRYTTGEFLNTGLGTFVDAFNPVGGSNNVLNFFAPTVLDPIVELYNNKDFAGRPIYKEGSSYAAGLPSSQMYFNSASGWAVWTTDQLNKLFGGNEVRPGAVDWSPDILDYLLEYFGGGTARFVNDMVSAPSVLMSDDPSVREIPLIRKFYGNVTTENDLEAFMKIRDEVGYAHKELELRLKNGDMPGAIETRKRYRKELAAYASIDAMDNMRDKLMRQIKKIEASRTIPDEKKRELVKKLRERITQAVTRAITLYNKRVRDQ